MEKTKVPFTCFMCFSGKDCKNPRSNQIHINVSDSFSSDEIIISAIISYMKNDKKKVDGTICMCMSKYASECTAVKHIKLVINDEPYKASQDKLLEIIGEIEYGKDYFNTLPPWERSKSFSREGFQIYDDYVKNNNKKKLLPPKARDTGNSIFNFNSTTKRKEKTNAVAAVAPEWKDEDFPTFGNNKKSELAKNNCWASFKFNPESKKTIDDKISDDESINEDNE
jgi:hypothetical protein